MREMPRPLVVLILALLLGLQAVTTDLYLPALPALKEDLGASMPQAQLTLTALLLAFGVPCQIVLAANLCCSGAWELTSWRQLAALLRLRWTC